MGITKVKGSTWDGSQNGFYYNVIDFGAKGDGTHDDTSAIQDALDAASTAGGGTIFIPKGTYLINPQPELYMWLTNSSTRKNYGCLTIDSNCTLIGEGVSSVLKLGSTLADLGVSDGRGYYSTTHMVINKNALGLPRTIVNKNIHVKDLTFDGNLINESGEGVTLCGVSQFSITGCTFKNTFYECTYMVFCRQGLWAHNHVYRCGQPVTSPLNDGGGPMADTCTGIVIRDSHMVDVGFYAILALDSYHCTIENNTISRETYDYAAGYQAIRIAACNQSIIRGNKIYEAGFNGIWIHSGRDNVISENIVVKCGHYAAAGSQLHGIQIDSNPSRSNGRHIITGNICLLNKGSGIALLDAILWDDITQYNTGNICSNNSCSLNYRDGITVYGYLHTISNNKIESNGLAETSGVVGDGYSGIALNGAQYCQIFGNTIQDVPFTTTQQMNLDAALSPNNSITPISVTHTTRTQNYGISELPALWATVQYTIVKALDIVTATTVGGVPHNFTNGQWVKLDDEDNLGFSGYYTITVTSTSTFTYDMTGAIPLPADGTYSGNQYASKILVSDYNQINLNNLANNLNNPGMTPSAGGYRAFNKPGSVCGTNSQKGNNLGQ